jgi:methanogenic corrinoid protein MtbC1
LLQFNIAWPTDTHLLKSVGAQMADATPIYNLKAVMREVGLSAATLRAWELRYGLPKPERTVGGHRLYSRQDIEMLKWLVARQNEGLSISHAVEMWKNQPTREQRLAPMATEVLLETGPGEGIFDELRQKWINACLMFDDLSANHILDQAFALATPEMICNEVLQKGLAQIGELWYTGTLHVQQEHFASAIAFRRLNSLLAGTVPTVRPGRIIAACPPGETHDFILLLVTYFLRRGGWDVIFLGSDVPLEDLDLTIRETKPVLVVSAAQTLTGAASLRGMSESLAKQGIRLAYGGGIFIALPETTHHISGYYLGDDILHIAETVKGLLDATPPLPTAQPLSTEYSIALERFQKDSALITSHVKLEMQSAQVDSHLLGNAIENLNAKICSAITLGDIRLLDPTTAWLSGLLKNHGFTPSIILRLFSVYRQAVQLYLGVDGDLITAWLDTQFSRSDLKIS